MFLELEEKRKLSDSFLGQLLQISKMFQLNIDVDVISILLISNMYIDTETCWSDNRYDCYCAWMVGGNRRVWGSWRWEGERELGERILTANASPPPQSLSPCPSDPSPLEGNPLGDLPFAPFSTCVARDRF